MDIEKALAEQRRHYNEKDRQEIKHLEKAIREMEGLHLTYSDLNSHRRGFIESYRRQIKECEEAIRKRGG